MKITVHQAVPGNLLLCGVPFAPGVLPAGSGLVLRDPQGQALPLWWSERAWWPDGSLKWIYLHARLSASSNTVELSPGEAQPAALSLDSANLLEVGGARLEWGHRGWIFSTAGQLVRVEPGRVATTPALGAAQTWTAELIEPSPLAPLLRLRQPVTAGLRFDHLLRLDPVQGVLHWQQRLSFLQESPCQLGELGATLRFGQNHEWVWQESGTRAGCLEVLRPGLCARDGTPPTAGHPAAALSGGPVRVVLEKAWQRAPFALAAGADQVQLDFYPASAPPLTVQSGTSFRHCMRIGLAGRDGANPAWSLDPETACSTGAFGPLPPRTDRTQKHYPGYEQAIDTCLRGGRLSALEKTRGGPRSGPAALADETAQDEEYFGLQHYGDWPMPLGAYGGVRRMYADNEYDVPYAYFLQFIRTGEGLFAEVAYHGAVHLADVDSKATNGDMHFHGYLEEAEDHADHRTPGGELGHYWTDGLVLNYLLRGDLWSWEAARAQAAFLLGLFAGEGDQAIRRHFLNSERAVGWPLVALAGVAEVKREPALLAKMQQMAAFLSRFTADPDRQLEEIDEQDGQPLRWWRICQEDGAKPFMVGVVLEGLERYHRLSKDPAAAQALLHLSRFLVEKMWVEGIEAFIYEWNAFNRGHREHNYPHYINMMVAPGLAYAYELSGEPAFRQVATRAFHASLWTLFAPDGGKEIGMVGRTSALMVGRLCAWQERDEATRRARLSPSNGVAFHFCGSPRHLDRSGALRLQRGTPRWVGEDLLSARDSFAVYSWTTPVGTERGRIGFTFTPDWDCPPHPGPVAQRAYLHLCDQPFTRSCLSVISFYTGLHVRFYDEQRHYIEVLEAGIGDWKAGQPPRIEGNGDTATGGAVLFSDGHEKDKRTLDRRLGGAFKRLHLGHRPGNWRAEGRLSELELDLG
ncbi:MAG: hypothetical protein IT369_04910 [Candidatus Latescibacteria bacterium]|nr:hypothetical protein [Candidatus Latescibacterota bacterium]